eukprot:UN26980
MCKSCAQIQHQKNIKDKAQPGSPLSSYAAIPSNFVNSPPPAYSTDPNPLSIEGEQPVNNNNSESFSLDKNFHIKKKTVLLVVQS